jgi:hypothetical protein
MSRKQAARKRCASERAQWTRRNAPAALCSCAGTGASPAARFAVMRPPANAARRRHRDARVYAFGSEAAVA